MKLFQQMLDVGASMGLLVPISAQASNIVDLEEMSSYSRSKKKSSKIDSKTFINKINENTANEVINAEGYWKEAALIVFSKKYKAGIGKDFKEQNKQKIFLQNRGFSFEEIDSVFT